MTDVLVERHWDVPLTKFDMRLMAEMADGCFGIHRVDWRGSLLSTDGAEMFCHFHAPDAESVRIALRQLGSPTGDVWSCTVRAAPQATDVDRAALHIVTTHRFDAPLDDAGLQALERSAAGAVDGGHAGLLRLYLSNDRRRMICLYHAADPGPVLQAQRAGGLSSEAAWVVRRYEP
jgi:hypothetical protein